jgi:hypothetical protein
MSVMTWLFTPSSAAVGGGQRGWIITEKLLSLIIQAIFIIND